MASLYEFLPDLIEFRFDVKIWIQYKRGSSCYSVWFLFGQQGLQWFWDVLCSWLGYHLKNCTKQHYKIMFINSLHDDEYIIYIYIYMHRCVYVCMYIYTPTLCWAAHGLENCHVLISSSCSLCHIIPPQLAVNIFTDLNQSRHVYSVTFRFSEKCADKMYASRFSKLACPSNIRSKLHVNDVPLGANRSVRVLRASCLNLAEFPPSFVVIGWKERWRSKPSEPNCWEYSARNQKCLSFWTEFIRDIKLSFLFI